MRALQYQKFSFMYHKFSFLDDGLLFSGLVGNHYKRIGLWKVYDAKNGKLIKKIYYINKSKKTN